MKIGVYGSAAGNISNQSKEKAKIIGAKIARLGHTIITGACSGLPYDAAKSAMENGGQSIGFSPATSIQEHLSHDYPDNAFTEFVFVPKNYKHSDDIFVGKKYRNVASVAEANAAIIIGGRIGTMNEFTNAYDLGKNIGVLEGSGGITENAIKILLKEANKESGSTVIFEADPQKLVEKLVSITK
ncbi:hypothetical protein ACFL21_03020 [Patescibacteria group bacterium]